MKGSFGINIFFPDTTCWSFTFMKDLLMKDYFVYTLGTTNVFTDKEHHRGKGMAAFPKNMELCLYMS